MVRQTFPILTQAELFPVNLKQPNIETDSTEKDVDAPLPLRSQQRTAGIDEAGRGCLAGPVVAAAVIMPDDFVLMGLDDSKRVPATRRAGLAAQIGQMAIAWGLGVVWPAEIDQINILEATFKAMSRAVRTLRVKPTFLQVDGNKTIPQEWLKREYCTPCPQQAIVDGDSLVPLISAASILAKVFRDDLMLALSRRYPDYGFEKHKGYGTKAHIDALKKWGPCPIHRISFRKVRKEHEQVLLK